MGEPGGSGCAAGAVAGGLAGCCAAAPQLNTPRKAPASKRLRGADEQILIMFSRLWKSSLPAWANPCPAGGLHRYSFEDFCTWVQSKNIRETGRLRASDAGIDAVVPV
jgi:hypothetical protein